MYINNFGYENAWEKENIINDAFKKSNKEATYVDFSQTKFRIHTPNFNGGTISTNCKKLDGEDLEIIRSFDLKELNNLENDLDYLKELIKNRKSELLNSVTEYKLEVNKTKNGNKKVVYINVHQYDKIKDIYGDSIHKNEQVIESYEIPNTKPYQEEIEKKIAELKTKYQLAWNVRLVQIFNARNPIKSRVCEIVYFENFKNI